MKKLKKSLSFFKDILLQFYFKLKNVGGVDIDGKSLFLLLVFFSHEEPDMQPDFD